MARATPLRILFVEDLPSDAELAEREVRNSGLEFTPRRVDTRDAFLSALAEFQPDVIVSDYMMPEFNGMQALKLLLERDTTIPFIVLTGSMNEETAVECMKAGATNYVIKEHVAGLPFAIKDALERKKVREAMDETERALRESEERYRTLVTFSPDALYVHVDNRIILVNPALCKLLGADDPSQLIGRSVFEIVHPAYYEKIRERWNLIFGGEPAPRIEEKFIRLDGSVVDVEVSAVAVELQGSRGVQVTACDITERKREEEELRFRNVILSTQQEASFDGILVVDDLSNIVSYNRRFVEMWGIPRELVEKKTDELLKEFNAGKVADSQSFLQRIDYLNEHKQETSWDEVVLKDGRIFDRYSAPMVGPDNRYYGRVWYFRDITERKRAEEVVRDSEERFRMVFEHVFDGISIYNEDPDPTTRKLIECNEQYALMSGRSREELLQLGSTKVLQRSLEDTANDNRVEAIGKGTAYRGSFSWIRPDGKDNVVEYVGMPITWQGKSYTIGIDRDITERTKADRELKLMAQTVSSARDCITITDLEDRLIFVNDAFCNTYGYTTEELLGKDISMLRPPGTPVTMTDRILHDTQDGGWHGELMNRRKDGTDFPVELWTSAVRDDAGAQVALVGVARDITDRTIVEGHLRESEEQFRLIAENVADMIAVLDLDGKRIYSSPSYRSILGDPESLKGTDSYREIHPDDREKVKRVFQETVRTGVGQRIEYRMVSKDGSLRTIESKGSVIKVGDGETSRVVVVSRDVTEEKLLAAQFLRAQRMESIGTLAGGIAHDLNNVLAPIMMAIEILRDKIPSPGGQKILTTIETSAKRGSDIVKQVLAFGRGVTGDRILVQLKHVVNEVAKIAHETFPKLIEIKTDIPRDLWTVSADPTQMHQVLLNMLVNARDAMPHGGTLSISAENVNLDAGHSHTQPGATPGPYVSIVISDTGTGIPADIQGKIFEPFFTTKEIGMGTGLGLSTTLAIVKSHGGFINLTSEVGKGTTFCIHIPATGTASGEALASVKADLPMGHGELILIIDDEAAVREITKETLEVYGYKAITANDGAEGVALFAENAKDIRVVITDMMMPVMGGEAVIVALHKRDPGVKIIATSGLTDKRKIVTPPDARVRVFLTKPYTAEKLLTTLKAVLRGGGLKA